jgi:hypothetical protein
MRLGQWLISIETHVCFEISSVITRELNITICTIPFDRKIKDYEYAEGSGPLSRQIKD